MPEESEAMPPRTRILCARLLTDPTSPLLQLRRELIGLPSGERRVKLTAARLLDSGRFTDSVQLEVSGQGAESESRVQRRSQSRVQRLKRGTQTGSPL